MTDTATYIGNTILYNSNSSTQPEFWGLYKIAADTLYLFRMSLNPINPPSKNLHIKKWLVRDRTLYPLTWTCNTRETIYSRRTMKTWSIRDGRGYRFFPSGTPKPDSSQAWFLDRSRFNEAMKDKKYPEPAYPDLLNKHA